VILGTSGAGELVGVDQPAALRLRDGEQDELEALTEVGEHKLTLGLVGRAGFEPATNGLKAETSSDPASTDVTEDEE